MDNSTRRDCSCQECAEKSKFPMIQKLCGIIKCLTNLTEIDLSSCNIYEVPTLIGNLVHIVKLNLSSNNLHTIPLSFTKLDHLTDLILSHNKFTQVPQCLIHGMHSVTMLDLSHNDLCDISIQPLCIQVLQTLNISNNIKLISFPQWLWSIKCNSLESLDVSFTNCLSDIEVDPYLYMYGIGNHLKYLDVTNSNSDVHKLDFVKHLKNLQTLVLNNADLAYNKYNNYLNNIPQIFNYRFKCVVSLSMSNVGVSNIGKHTYFCLPSLRVLDLSKNCIVLLPESLSELTNLEICDFSSNQIFTIPICFKSLKNLKKLVLNNNWISTFPNILEDLINLEFLDLYDNRLVVCPVWNLNSNLKSVDLEQNVFSTEKSTNQNLQPKYSKLLNNLRLLINESRATGPLFYADDANDPEYSDNSVGSNSQWSSNSSSEIDQSNEEKNLEDNYFQPEEPWECNSYEHTTALFDPKEFESTLIEEFKKLENPLSCTERTKEKNNLRKIISISNEHYFCPCDEFPTS